MKFRASLLSAVAVLTVFYSTAHAQLFWDINGAAAGATADGGGVASGIWDVGSGPLGDYTHDGVVDSRDYVLWRKNDINGAAGYAQWVKDYGSTGGGGGTANWTTDSTGASASVGWTAGETAVFSAGTVAGGGASSGASTVTLSGTQSAAGITFQEGTFTLTGSELDLTGAGTITTSTGTTSTINSVVGGATLTKEGADRLLLTAANTYNGGTAINNGTLQHAKTNSMPSVGTTTVGATSTLSVNVGGAGEWSMGTSGSGTFGGLIAGTGGQGSPVEWVAGSNLGIDTANAAGTLTYSNAIGSFHTSSGTTNAVGLSKRGVGTLELSGANTYTGATTLVAVPAGTPNVIKAVATNTLPASTVLTLPAANGNAIVELFNASGTPFNQTVAGISGGGIGNTSPTIIDIGKATFTVDVPTGQAYVYNGYIKSDFASPSDRGKMIKTGDGDLTLGGQNNVIAGGLGFGGEFSMEGGRLIYTNNVGTGGGDATKPSQLTLKGGTIVKNLTNASDSLSITPRTLVIAGSFAFDMNGSTANAQILPSAPGGGLGGISLAVNNPTITVNNGAIGPNGPNPVGFTPTFILSGIITDGPNSFGFTKAGPGVLTLDRVNTYDGTTTVTDGALRVTAAVGSSNTLISTIGNGSTSPIVLAGGALEYTGALINGARVGTINNPVTMTSSSSITHNTGSGASGLSPNVDFMFSNFTATAGTLTLQNKGGSNEPNVANPTVNPVEFRVGFTGSGFNFGQPIVLASHPTVANRTSALMGANTSGSQTFSGIISGPGAFVRNGASGETVLTAQNTYTGGTKLLAGTLTLPNANALSDLGDVFFITGGGQLNLTGGFTETIDQLFVNGAAQAPGLYDSGNLSAFILGSGKLLVSAGAGGGGAVPEPGTFVMAVVMIFGLAAGNRRRG